MRRATWGRLLIIVMLLSFFLMIGTRPAMAEGNVLQWIRVNTPQDGASGDWVIASGTDVNRIAVGSDGKTIYALDRVTPLLFRSSDGGYTWLDITGRLPGFGSLDDLAVSPDDPNFLAVVDATTPEVFLSVDGGASFAPTGIAGLTVTGIIQDIAISSGYNDGGGINREIMFGTSTVGTLTGAGRGQVWVMSAGAQFHSWTDVSTGAAGWAAADVFTVAFSPNYAIDRVVLLITADLGATWLYIGRMDIAASQATWNSPLFSGYPVAIAEAGEDSPGTPLTYAALALPSDYSGADIPLRRVYVAWSDGFDSFGGNTNDDVYRLDDTAVVRLDAGNGFEFVSASLAYYGTHDQGKLLAGRQTSTWVTPMAPCVQVRSSLDPQAKSPTWRDSLKPPTGANEAQVAWSADGEIAFCGTSGGAANDESAFSRSADSGLSWNQTGLIDTAISTINDIEVSARGEALFITTVNAEPGSAGTVSADSLWRSTSTPLGSNWERVLARASTGDNPLVRIDPDYAKTKVVWHVNTGPAMPFQELLRSEDGGDTYLARFPNIVLVDFAVEDAETVYGLDAAGFVSKGTDGGKIWGIPVNTYVGIGYSIACARTTTAPDNPKGNVLVGGTGSGNYDVAYSTDGSVTFTPIEVPLPTRDNTLVVASSSYDKDGSILAINSGGMYCWGIFSGKAEWEVWWGGPSWPSAITALKISRSYGFYFSTPSTPWSSATPYVRWCAATAGLDPTVDLGTQPTKRMAICGGMELNEPITFWVIDQRSYSPPRGGLWYYIDTLSWLGPRPMAPISRAVVNYDPASGRAGQIIITWESLSRSTGYEVQVALDDEFNTVIADIGGGWAGPFYYPPAHESPALVIPPGGGTVADGKGNTWTVPALSSGKTYYWKVKVQDVATGDAIQSPWSWAESFTVEIGAPVRAPYLGPILLSPVNGAIEVPPQPPFSWATMHGATEYEFILSGDAAMTDVIIRAIVPTPAYTCENRLTLGKMYFWRVRVTKPVASEWSPTGIFTVAKEL